MGGASSLGQGAHLGQGSSGLRRLQGGELTPGHTHRLITSVAVRTGSHLLGLRLQGNNARQLKTKLKNSPRAKPSHRKDGVPRPTVADSKPVTKVR